MNKKSLNELLREGEKAIDLGKDKTAIKLLSAALKRDPGSVTAYFYLALAKLHVGRFKEAERDARYVLELSPNERNAWLNLGVIKLKQRDIASAMRCYRKEIRLHPEGLEANYNLGLNHLKRRQWKRAVNYLEKCWRSGHAADGLDEDLALAARKARRHDLEEEVYTEELGKQPDNVWALNNLATIRNHYGRHEEARLLLEKAQELDPSNKIVRLNLKDTLRLEARQLKREKTVKRTRKNSRMRKAEKRSVASSHKEESRV